MLKELPIREDQKGVPISLPLHPHPHHPHLLAEVVLVVEKLPL